MSMNVMIRDRETGLDSETIENVEILDLREKKGRRVFLIAGNGHSRFVALKDYELTATPAAEPVSEAPAEKPKPAARKKAAAAK